MQKMNKEKRNKREKIDREIITKLLNTLFVNTNFEYKEYVYESIDVCFTGASLNCKATYDIEIKSRDLHISRYNNCFLECDKYHRMLSNEYTNERKIYVAIYHKDDKIIVWDLNKIDNVEQYHTKRWMNDETCSDKPKKVLKDVFELPFILAKEFCYSCNGMFNEVLN